MNLKNYTSDVPVSRTIARIEEALAAAGANSIQKDYDAGQLVALMFRVQLPTGRAVAIRLPADTEAVCEVMMKQIKRPRSDTVSRVRDQAARCAWKLMQDWVLVQLSLIQMQKADFLQVFLPYVWDGRKTFYQQIKEKKFLSLPSTE